jgi:hypothetical protein
MRISIFNNLVKLKPRKLYLFLAITSSLKFNYFKSLAKKKAISRAWLS